MEIRLYKSPWRALKLLLGCAAFVAIGLWMIHKPDAPTLVGWASIVFFGLGGVVSLFQLLDRRPQIIINELGIFDRVAHYEFINWEIIQDAYLMQVHKEKLLCLVVPEAFEPSQRKTGIGKALKRLSKELGFQELTIPLGLIHIDEVRFTQFVVAMTQAERPTDRTQLLTQYTQ
ncbi:STM3941 family protein [Hymenobacter sp. 102]|uniref:STM3941 family protein n=1 Tax=Hymenobacter sp. 102 TaxID=3403152 RepID=UPI003CF6E626